MLNHISSVLQMEQPEKLVEEYKIKYIRSQPRHDLERSRSPSRYGSKDGVVSIDKCYQGEVNSIVHLSAYSLFDFVNTHGILIRKVV